MTPTLSGLLAALIGGGFAGGLVLLAVFVRGGTAPPARPPSRLELVALALSADLKDASADKVIGSLILNVRQRGTGLATVLTSLASAGRAELDQRRRIMAGRASMRRSVRIVVIITIAFAVFLVIFSRSY